MEDLIEKHMPLVASIVNSFHPKNQAERENYLQAGRIGLWKALQNFNPAKGNVLSTYAWNPIRWEIMQEIRLAKKSKETISLNEDWTGSCVKESSSSFWEFIPPTLTSLEDTVIQLRLEGYNFQEISSKLNCPRSRIRTIFNSATEKIRVTNE